MKKLLTLLALFTAASFATNAHAAARPNIIYILCDDLGYGDVKALNPDGKIATPNLDKLAAGGMIFTDVHSSSSVCTPTRYGILTGRYNWRTRLKSGVLGGLSPRLIEDGRLTVADLLKQNGYATACIGKWHLGMEWVKKGEVSELNIETREQAFNVDFTKPIKNGPLAVGFDYYFGIAASLDMVPYTFIENDRVTVLPTEDRRLDMMTGRENWFTREGPAAPGFTGYEVLPTLTKKAVEYIAAHAAEAKKGKPFFLYLPLNAPHTPILPTPEWLGKSGLNPYADFVMETDHHIGLVMAELEKQGLAKDTLLIATSDNGCSPSAKFDELKAKGHNPSFVFRGHKADIFDGGHHIPFIARWPAQVKAGSKSDQLLCLSDFMATAAEIIGAKLPATAGEDSVSFLPALLGKDKAPLREAIVHHSINGSFAIRQANWKLELTPSSGGWSEPRPNSPAVAGLRPIQLYDLATDIGETKNLQAEHPEIVSRLTKLLEKYVADGRSTPGAKQENTTPVDIWKAGKEAPGAAKKKKAKKDA
ncbi:MAG: arylsulfatase [Verrucomicrobia bacterium]|nr:arylsulfatase [Verrucomicrobiota bacterium]